MMFSDQGEFYNAWDEDIAVVNIFFGKETVMGRKGFFPHDDCKSGSPSHLLFQASEAESLSRC